MKKAFSMIEMIFVIAILGILAAVSVSKITTTRDDAEIVKFLKNTHILINDIIIYYSANAGFADSISKMTKVKLYNSNNNSGVMKIADKNCLNIAFFEINNDEKPAFLKLEKATQESKLCKKVMQMQAMVDLFNTSFSYKDSQGNQQNSNKGEIMISGIKVVY